MSFSEWREVKLGDLVEVSSSKRIYAKEYVASGIPFYRSKEIIEKSKSNDVSTELYISKERFNELKNKFGAPSLGDILLTSVGTLGVPYIVRKEEFYFKDGNLTWIKNFKDNCHNKFIFYWLLSPDGVNQINARCIGSTQKALTIDTLKKFELKIPPLDEQKAIAHILSTLDDKIEVNNQINKTLENMAQAIFKQWFVDFEFPNEDGEPYKSSGGEMIESELGMIPKGWEVGKFIDLIEITSGKRPGKRSELAMEDSKYPLVGASSIMGYTDDFNFEEKILVIGRVGTHGVVQRFNNKVWASDNTLVIKSDNYEFAYQILNQIDYKAINRGSTQPLITQTDIKNYTLIIPTEVYLSKFELLVGSLFEIHSNHCIENSKLTEIRDSLLPKLMSGEIRVSLDAEDDAS